MTDVSHVAKIHPSSVQRLRPLSGAVAVVSLTIAGALVLLESPAELQAAPVSGLDYDGDGLTDMQELVLGTYPYTADSDEDGFDDAEEVARQSDPLDLFSVPTSTGISASLTARGEDDKLRIVMCVYEPVGQLFESKVRLGALRNRKVVSVPLGRILGLSDVLVVDGTNGSRVITIEIPINPNFVHGAGRATIFIAAGNVNTPAFGSAAKIDLTSTDGILLLQRVNAAQAQAQATQGGGSIRQPIPSAPAPSMPTSWAAGAICYQRSTVVGGTGAVVLHQVVEADCLQGWDSYCASDCSSSVGSSYQTIDPAALLGG